MGCNFEGNWKHTLGTKQINFRLKKSISKFKISEYFSLWQKNFHKVTPPIPPLLKIEKRWSPEFPVWKNCKTCKSSQRGEGVAKFNEDVVDELIFRILRISNTWYSLDQSFFKSFLTATDFYQQILTRKCQILFKSVIFIIEFTSEIAYLKVSVSNYFDAHWKTDREPLPCHMTVRKETLNMNN